uniref:Uncharacterized protein n=1 Tax=Panagrolaimus sp. PS1159 TaxID=55785 RepID=A0AC35FB23_9BILA
MIRTFFLSRNKLVNDTF